ncbi:MAG: hypothetical protein ACE5D0_07110 [Fidelibacterota bacterium]
MKILLKYSLIILTIFAGSCSTLSFIPREGGGAKFNLATVEYVQTATAGQKEEIVQQIKGDMEEILNSLLEDDRATLKNLETLLADQAKRMDELSATVDNSNASLEMLSTKLVKDLSDVKSSARDIQMYIDQLETSMKTLPVEALRELNTALDEYMAKRTQENKE